MRDRTRGRPSGVLRWLGALVAIAAPLALNVSPAAAVNGVGGASARGTDPDATLRAGTVAAQFSAITNCAAAQSTRPFYVRWTSGSTTNTFKKTGAASTSKCFSNGGANINEGTGTGTINGSPGANVSWHFADGGGDVAKITVTPSAGGPLTIEGTPQPWKGSQDGVRVFRDLPWPAQAPVPFRFFSPSSFWNTPLSPVARLDPDSGSLSAQLRDMAAHEVAAKKGPWIETHNYTTPLYTVPADQPTVRVALSNGTVAWRQSLQAAFGAVPIPPGARPAAGTDAQMTIWQPSTDRLWDFAQARQDAQGNWYAEWGGAMQNVRQSPGYYTPDSWPGAAYYWGATAPGLPKIGGTILLDELRQGHIDHALAIDIPVARANLFSWPAQNTDGRGGADAIPEGARFRLDPSLDIASLQLPPLVRMIAEAAQRYGMVVRDQTGPANAIGFFVEDTSVNGPAADPFWAHGRPRPDGYLQGIWPYKLMAKFPWGRVQLLQMTLCNKASATCPWPR